MTLPLGAVLARGGVGAAEVQVGAAGVEGVGDRHRVVVGGVRPVPRFHGRAWARGVAGVITPCPRDSFADNADQLRCAVAAVILRYERTLSVAYM